ncbi:F-box domain-containing protein [Dioscorea alata]|uniref:F-box domain-containing protein n=1 Tax=Dioscorea alata TaxID=55571 RepID=A0ACB7URQ8_DIOAL|nr:F-box domain-containing protein [Dioscorea alata]
MMMSKKQMKRRSNEVRDWSSLPKLPLSFISSQLDPISHVFFRSTCSAWRTFSPRPKFPLIILANHTISKRYTSMAFFDIDFNLLFRLPKCSFEFGSFFCGSSHGYLVFLDPASKLYLINPITGHQIKLPKHNAQYRKNKKFIALHFQINLALSAPPTDPQCVFAAISRSQNQVDVCKMRSISWKTLLSDECLFRDIVFYKGYFYLCSKKALYRLDLEANGGTGMIVNVPLALPVLDSSKIDKAFYDKFLKKTYLVELSGYLHMVLMYYESGKDSYYEFLKVNFEKERLEMIQLGIEDLMFLGISLGIGTNARRYQGCSDEGMFLTKLAYDMEEPGVFCVENSNIKCYLKEFHGIDQWDTLGWLAPNFSV